MWGFTTRVVTRSKVPEEVVQLWKQTSGTHVLLGTWEVRLFGAYMAYKPIQSECRS